MPRLSRRARIDAAESTAEPREDVLTTLAAPGEPAAPPPPPPPPLWLGRTSAGGRGTPRPAPDEKLVVRTCPAGSTNRSATDADGGLRREVRLLPGAPAPSESEPGLRASVGVKSGPSSREKKREERRDSSSASSKEGEVR